MRISDWSSDVCSSDLNSGVQMGGWFRKEIKSLEDFRGLKMRIPGLGGAVVAKLGGTTVTLPASEVFQALQSGTIDATEWVGPWNDLALGFYKVAKNYYYPGFHEPGSAFRGGISLRSEERSGGKEGVSTCSFRGAPVN